MAEKVKHVLKRIKLTNLFGAFDHEITLKKDRGITLVLGENGLGKTAILKMLKAVFEQRFNDLSNYSFQQFDLEFEDYKFSFFGSVQPEDERLIARKYKGNKKLEELDFYDNDSHAIIDQLSLFERRERYFEDDFIHRRKYNSEIIHIVDSYLDRYVHRVGPDEWRENHSGKIYRTRTVLKNYSKALPKRFQRIIESEILPEWLEEFSERLNVYLIETQRLTQKKSADSYADTVIEISRELSSQVQELLASANEFASQLDRTYPNRLLNRINELEKISDVELELKLELLETRRSRLREVGLIDPVKEEIQLGPSQKRKSKSNSELINNVLLVYIEDSNRKLNIYDEIAHKLEVFIGILNKRLNVKTVQVDREEGLKITSEKMGRTIPLKGLSSGEQHMIILFYNLLFKCKEESLILIDEPEISLHINWQNNFIDDLHVIQSITPFEALIATHSPDIINEKWDLTVQLTED